MEVFILMITLEQIRERLIETIKQSGYTQTKLAEKLKVSPSTISHYLRGDKMPTPKVRAMLLLCCQRSRWQRHCCGEGRT